MTASIAEPTVATTTSAFRLERDGELAVLWFDLPGEKVNKLSSSVMLDLDRHLDAIRAMSDVKKLIVTSAKSSIFIAGADITEFTRVTTAEQAEEFTRFGQSVFTKIAKLPQITFALINGACMGGGTELSLNCDYRLMTDSPKASIALPEVKLGIFPAWTGTTRLPRLVGLPAALDMILTGKSFDGRRAKKIGLVDEVVPAPIALEAAKQFVRKTSRKPRGSERTHIYLEGNPLARKMIFNQARKSVMATTRGQYPAPLVAIDVMELGYSKGVDEAYKAEAREAVRLIMGPVAQNLVRLFFMMEEAKKERGTPRPIESAGVLGAGLMGGGIAHAIVDKADINVRLKDVNWNALSSGLRGISKLWKKSVERKRMTRGEMERKLARVTTTTDWSGFAHVDIVLEAVLEKLEIKQQVLRELESIAKETAIFATNTSTIPITKIAEASKRPENVIGMHFFSPVDKMPLLEIIVGEKTSDSTLATAAAFGKRIGKTVVVCKDGPGFIVNRILGPYLNEAGFLLEDGTSIEAIDDAMVKFGMPLGPLALLDEVGIDVAGKAGEVLQAAFGNRMPASKLIAALVADNRFGKKNARGVYQWKEGKRTAPDAAVYKLLGAEQRVETTSDAIAERMVLVMINEAALILDEKIAASAADVDLAMILGTGFPPFRGGLLRHADTLGIPYVVARLDDLESRHGRRFVATEPLRRLAAEGKTFYQAYPKS
ncbi:MAG TPA: 3-hydroxyacyl-CoA dehydrogenase NAD-binding domain-containing protein [Thermoanaerobaculia bacterium]